MNSSGRDQLNNYSPQDVHVVWTKSRHVTSRGLTVTPAGTHGYFKEAVDQDKMILVKVMNIIRYGPAAAYSRTEFFALLGARNVAPGREPVQTAEDRRNYWHTHEATVEEQLHSSMFQFAGAYSKILMIQPGTTQPARFDNERPDRRPTTAPRIRLKPKYGWEYMCKESDSMDMYSMTKWGPVIAAAFEAIRLQFFTNPNYDE